VKIFSWKRTAKGCDIDHGGRREVRGKERKHRGDKERAIGASK